MTCSSFSSGGYNASRDLCVGSGCHWVPAANTCAASSPCSNGTCLNACGDTTACGPAYSYTAIAPIGTSSNLSPDFSWSMYNPTAGTNLYLWRGANCQGAGNMFSGTWGPNTFSTPLSSFSCTYNSPCFSNTALTPNTAYSWVVYGHAPNDSYPGSGCINFTTPNIPNPTCTVTLSPTSLTLQPGVSRTITANVTVQNGNQSNIASITWTSSSPAVASVTSPGNSTTVTGLTSGTANVSATVTLTPGTNTCTTNGTAGNSNPATVTVVQSYFQTFGGNVSAKGQVSDSFLPAGKYISGAGSLPATKPNGQSCSTGNQCASGYCADGVCCNTACTGSTCQRCDSYSSAGAGTCGFVSTQVDPDNECTAGANTCSGNNVVTGASGNCSGTGYACDTGGSVVQTCTPTTATCKTGGGCSNGSCVAVTNVTAYNESPGCTGTCTGCNGSGSCVNIPNATQDTWGSNTCSAAHYRCNGSGSCVAASISTGCAWSWNPNGTTCNSLCASYFGSNNAGCVNVWWGPPYDTTCSYVPSSWSCGTFGYGGVDCKCNVYSY